MNHKNLENKIKDDEILNVEDEKISALLGNLKRIDAPADFDFRLRARIARAEKFDYRAPRFLPVLRYVLPLGLVLFVSALAVLNGVYFADRESASTIAGKRIEFPASNSADKQSLEPTVEPTPNLSETARLEPKDSETIAVSARVKNADKYKPYNANPSVNNVLINRNTKTKNSTDRKTSEIVVGSRTSASTSANTITPPGINPNKTVQSSPNVKPAKPLTVREVLQQLGIEAVYEGENWTVKSVGQNTLAERSGVKSGDAVEAIDDERLTEKPLKRATIEGKKLTIARGAEKIEIALSGRQN